MEGKGGNPPQDPARREIASGAFPGPLQYYIRQTSRADSFPGGFNP